KRRECAQERLLRQLARPLSVAVARQQAVTHDTPMVSVEEGLLRGAVSPGRAAHQVLFFGLGAGGLNHVVSRGRRRTSSEVSRSLSILRTSAQRVPSDRSHGHPPRLPTLGKAKARPAEQRSLEPAESWLPRRRRGQLAAWVRVRGREFSSMRGLTHALSTSSHPPHCTPL